MARKSQKTVGVIGLGIIGSRVASVLRSKGWHVCVWNRTPKPEPSFLGSPAEVAAVCDVIQIFVADWAALQDVLKAFGDSLTKRHTILCNATIGREETLEAASLILQTGASFLDAPFTGSKTAAEKGGLVYYVGGDEGVLRRVEPILQASSKAIVRAGSVGDAATLKIATNMMVAVTVQALAEALALVRASGIAPERLSEAIEHHGVRSGITDMKIGNMIHGDFSPHFSSKNMLKDLKIALNMARPLDLKLPTTSVVTGLLYEIMERGEKDLDYSALMNLYDNLPALEPAAAPSPQESPTEAAGAETKTPAELAATTVEAEKSSPSVSKEAARPGAPEPPQSLEAEVVSQSSSPTAKPEPNPAQTRGPSWKGVAPLAQKVRKWLGR